MPVTRHLKVREKDVLLLVGTMKGAFILRSDGTRRAWEMGGPHFPGQPVYSLAYDDRAGRRRLWAGPDNPYYGASLRTSDDFGRTWAEIENPLLFPKDTEASLKRVWQIQPGRTDEPEVLYCGVEPAALFESRDGGANWALVRALWNHPHRPRWNPGGGGLCLHTVLPDPARRQRIHVAVSSAGVYRTDDGGRTWATKHKGVRAQFLPDPHPEFGQCVHKVVRHAAKPDRLFLQNHWGLYRSDDGGEAWTDVAKGVPSDFGFAMAIHPHDPDTVYIVPLESDEFRCVPDGKLRVYRTRNAARSWQPLAKGLPENGALETVLRDALATDTLEPAGVFFGTRSGKVYASRDEGDSWRLLADGLPPVVCVKAAVIGSAPKRRASPKRKPAAKARRTRRGR